MHAKRIMKEMNRSLRCRRGFSLAEILVTCMIFSLLAAAINSTILVGNSSWQANSTEVELQQGLRQAMERMRHDLQQTGAVSFDFMVGINGEPDPVTYHASEDCYLLPPAEQAPGCDPAYDWGIYTTLTFQTVDGASNRRVSWDANWTSYFLNGNELERTYGTQPTAVVAGNLQSIQIRRLYDSTEVVEVRLTAQKDTLAGAQGRTISSTLNFDVQLRN